MSNDNEIQQLIRIYAIVVSAIFLYWTILKSRSKTWDITRNDVLNETVIASPIGNISWWPLSHFIFNALLGFFYPNKGVFILSAGVLWEFVEIVLGMIAKRLTAARTTKLAADTEDGERAKDLQYTDGWWAGSVQDVVFNTAGFFTGKALRQFLSK